MTYETIDWDGEAKRIQWAFSVTGEKKFFDFGGEPWLVTDKFANTDLWVEAGYNIRSMTFCIEDNIHEQTYIEIGWDGAPIVSHCTLSEMSNLLTKGLFNLGLLTPEVEEALQITISNQQKAEWTLEYAKRLEAAA